MYRRVNGIPPLPDVAVLSTCSHCFYKILSSRVRGLEVGTFTGLLRRNEKKEEVYSVIRIVSLEILFRRTKV